jgi:hypothetical protein
MFNSIVERLDRLSVFRPSASTVSRRASDHSQNGVIEIGEGVEAFRRNHIVPVLVCEAMIFQPSSNFWSFMVLFAITFCLEPGKETDHQVRASARSGFSSLTWMRLGWMNPIAIPAGYSPFVLPPISRHFSAFP